MAGREKNRPAILYGKRFCTIFARYSSSSAQARRHIRQYASAGIVFEKIEPKYGELYSFGKKVPPRHI